MRALVFSIDDQYVMPFQVLFHSLHQTKSFIGGTPLLILHDTGLSTESIEFLETFLNGYGQDATFVNAGHIVPDDLPLQEGDHVSKATFFRLFVSSILPPHITSVLYLDSDTVVVRSIRQLLQLELTAPVAAVDHLTPENSLRLWGWACGDYFQAGVILIDLEHWRAHRCEDSFLEIMRTQRNRIKWWDQDILNIAFENVWQRLDIWFNVNEKATRFIEPDIIANNARLIHFDGDHKPWLHGVERPFKNAWLDAYANLFGEKFAAPETRSHSIPLYEKITRAITLRLKGLFTRL